MRACVLIVCTGNICRSPTAEVVLRSMAQDRSILLDVFSCGLSSYHTGESPISWAVLAAQNRNYDLSSLKASVFHKSYFNAYEYILAMDKGHLEALCMQAPANCTSQIMMFMHHAGNEDVPDPYDGDKADYYRALKLIERGSIGWIDYFAKM